MRAADLASRIAVAGKRVLRVIPRTLVAPLLFAVALTLVMISVSEFNYSTTVNAIDRLRVEREHIDMVDEMLVVLLYAETGQRGYLLSGNGEYLVPLEFAKEELPRLQNRIAIAFTNRPDQRAQADQIRQLAMKKLLELETTVQLFKLGEKQRALELVATDQGRQLMEDARRKIVSLSGEMTSEFVTNRDNWQQNMLIGRLGLLAVSLLNLMLLAIVIYLLARNLRHKDHIAGLIDSENVRLGRLVAERTAELDQLSTHLQQSSERDRAILARNLHDELGGILTSVKMDIDWLRKHIPALPDSEKRIGQVTQLLDNAVMLKRRLVEDLRPSLLDNIGLGAALEWHVTEHCDKAGIKCELNIEDELGDIPPDPAIALYRIAQEALTNVLRHANAATFRLCLSADGDGIRLTLSDDGDGLPASFNPASLSHGLSGMRQRARALGGEVHWKSRRSRGTTIEAFIPRQIPDIANVSVKAA